MIIHSFWNVLFDLDPLRTTTTTTTAAPSGGGYFPSASKIKLENGKSVMMSELQIGDQVQTGADVGRFLLCFLLFLYQECKTSEIITFQCNHVMIKDKNYVKLTITW